MNIFTRFGISLVIVALFSFLAAGQDATKKVSVKLPKGVLFSDFLHLGPKKIIGLKVGQMSPSEVTGFELSRWPKLTGVRLGITRRDEINGAFGSDCTDSCGLEPGWRVYIRYYAAAGAESTVTQGELKWKLIPRKEYRDRVSSIRLRPDKPFAVIRAKFSDQFYRTCGVALGSTFVIKGEDITVEEAKPSIYGIYIDGYGLSYYLGSEPGGDCCSPAELPQTELIASIEYKIPGDLEQAKIYKKAPVH